MTNSGKSAISLHVSPPLWWHIHTITTTLMTFSYWVLFCHQWWQIQTTIFIMTNSDNSASILSSVMTNSDNYFFSFLFVIPGFITDDVLLPLGFYFVISDDKFRQECFIATCITTLMTYSFWVLFCHQWWQIQTTIFIMTNSDKRRIQTKVLFFFVISDDKFRQLYSSWRIL